MSSDDQQPSREPDASPSVDRSTTTLDVGTSLQLLVAAIRDYAILLLDPDGHIVSWNTGAHLIKGYREQDIVGKHFSVFYTDADRERDFPSHELLVASQTGRFEDEGWRVRNDGSQFWASVVITALRDEDGILIGYGKVTRDLTERKVSEDALMRSAERFRRVFDDAPNGLVITDDEGRLLQLNVAFAELVDSPVAELVHRPFFSLAHPDDAGTLIAALRRVGEGRESSALLEVRLQRSSGDVRWARIHVAPLTGAHSSLASSLVSHIQDITEHRTHEERLLYQATHDPLTGLFNRRRFEDELRSHLLRANRYSPAGAVLILDLDNFKLVNDTLGHSAGDQLLIQTASALRDRLRGSDVIARLGGDEFAVLLPAADRSSALAVAHGLLAAVREVSPPGQVGRVTTSIGMTMIDNARLTVNDLLVNADLSMYDAKDGGRDQAVVSSDESTTQGTRSRMMWGQRIQDALTNNGFRLWAQPILNLQTDEVDRFEILLRMLAPEGDIISPGTFMTVAERLGLVSAIDAWVITHSIPLLVRLHEKDPRLKLEINLSGLSVGRPEVLDLIARLLEETGVDPAGLVFEVTETAAVSNLTTARDFAIRLRNLGCRFALDDFGAGFGSFYYLKHIPFDYVKIDGEFINNATTTPIDRLIITSLVTIARGLGKSTVAEFVEDEPTLQLLRDHGVDFAQGYHIGRPGPADAVLGLATVERTG